MPIVNSKLEAEMLTNHKKPGRQISYDGTTVTVYENHRPAQPAQTSLEKEFGETAFTGTYEQARVWFGIDLAKVS